MLLALVTLAWAEPAAPEGAKRFRCCDDAGVTRVVEALVKLHGAVVAGDDGLVAALDSVRAEVGRLGAAESEVAGRMRALLDRGRARTPAAVRDAFRALAPFGVLLALRHEGGALEVAEAGCGGLTWLQRPDRSPAMPGCAGAQWR
jgi:hypothetical protein